VEELVNELAELQAEMDNELIKADFASAKIDYHIDEAIKRLDMLRKERDINRQPYTERIEEITTTIMELHTAIIDEWGGEKKTLVFDAGALKFRTSGGLKIRDEPWLLERIVTTTSFTEAANKYLKGFNLTAVKKYMSVHELPSDVAEIEHKTTVKLEVHDE